MRLRLREIEPARVRFWAWLDSSVALWLGLPPLARGFVHALYAVNGWLGGAAQPPPFAPIQWFFACLCGALVGLWCAARLAWPNARLAFADVLGRVWIAGLLIWFVAAEGAPRVLLVFVLTELAGAVAQWRALAPRRVPGSSIFRR